MAVHPGLNFCFKYCLKNLPKPTQNSRYMGKQIFPITSTWVLHHLCIITGNQSVFILETNDNLKYMYLKD